MNVLCMLPRCSIRVQLYMKHPLRPLHARHATKDRGYAGGGTVKYVNQHSHWFESDVERREEAGTPDVLGAIRSALALQLHTQLSQRITHSLPSYACSACCSRLAACIHDSNRGEHTECILG